MIRGVVETVARVVKGSATISPLAIGDTVIEIANASDFAGPGTGELFVAGATIAYTEVLDAEDYDSGVSVDTLVLADPSPVAAAVNVRVDVVPATIRYVAQVRVGAALAPESAVVKHKLIDTKALEVGVALSTPVWLVEETDPDTGEVLGWIVDDIIDQDPSTNLAFATPSTLPPEAVNALAFAVAGKIVAMINAESAHHPDLTITGADLRSAEPGTGLQVARLSSDGFSRVDETGSPDVAFSNEPGARAMLQGFVRALSLAVDTGAISQQMDLLPASVLNWASQFPPPQHGPTVVPYWESIAVPPLQSDEAIPSGLFRKDGMHWTVTGPITGQTTYLTSIEDDGTLTHVYPTPEPLAAANGLTHIGTTWWIGGYLLSNLQSVIWPMSDTGVFTNTFWTFSRLGVAITPCIGNDGTNILVADIDPATFEVVVTRIDPATGATVSVVTLPPIPLTGARQLAGIYYGSADFGENCYVVWADFEDKRRALVCRAADLTDWDSDRNFDFANDEATIAACWSDDLTRFASIGNITPGIWLYGDNSMDGLDLVTRFTQTWYNSHPYETTRAGHNTRLKSSRRGGYRANSGTLPGGGGPADPQTARIYFTNTDGASIADWSLEGTTDPVTGDLIIVSPALGFEGLPAVNTFPTGSYALMTRDGVTTILVPNGDGTYAGELIDYLIGLITGAFGVDDDVFLGTDYIEVTGRV